MAVYTRYKKLVVENEGEAVYLMTREWDGSLKYLVSNEYIDGYVPVDEIERAIRSPISQRFFKLFILHENETRKKDITQYVIPNGNLEKTYQQGSTRSLSLTLMNPEKIWLPSPIRGTLWTNTKFELIMGIQLDNTIYWEEEGIFVCQDPDLSNGSFEKTISIQLLDKFALLDGTISGKLGVDYQIPLGTKIFTAIKSLLVLNKDRLGNSYDFKTPIFPNRYAEATTPYTLKKTPENTIGEILIDLANMISCDIFYDEYGRLTLRENIEDLDLHHRPVRWQYRDVTEGAEFFEPTMKIEWSKIVNKVYVIGMNINGRLCKGEAENTNPKSAYNINGLFGEHPLVINDELINSDERCKDRAEYELKKNSMKYISINMNSIYIPHLNCNDLVRWSFEDYNYNNQIFAIQSLTIPLNPRELMGVSMTNIEDLPLAS